MNWSGQPMRTTGVAHSQIAQLFQHGAAEASGQHVVLQRQHHLHAAREKLQHLGVHRLGEARIDHRRRNALALQLAAISRAMRHHRAQSENRHAVVLAVLQQFGLADRDGRGPP